MSEALIAPLNCFVVDDTLHDRDLLVTTLKTIGVKHVITAGNGSEAFQALAAATKPADLVLCDIRMPNGNGLQLLHAIRNGAIKNVRMDASFILVTAHPTAEAVKIASSLDAHGFVVKPVLPEKLSAVVLKARRTTFPVTPGRYAKVSVPGTF